MLARPRGTNPSPNPSFEKLRNHTGYERTFAHPSPWRRFRAISCGPAVAPEQALAQFRVLGSRVEPLDAARPCRHAPACRLTPQSLSPAGYTR